MLGEQIEELRGKITGQRMVNVDTIETTVSSSGNIEERKLLRL
jgi:hypothetical protein